MKLLLKSIQDIQSFLLRIRADERNTQVDQNTSYLISYPEFLQFFKSKSVLSFNDITIGIHAVYGWMPTIFDFRSNRFQDVVAILNAVKLGAPLTEDNLRELAECFNNSVVGTSKLLHFIAPSEFPIIDSKVWRYLTDRNDVYYAVRPAVYLEYLVLCRNVIGLPGYEEIHNSMVSKIGYDITPLRSLELIMFTNGIFNKREPTVSGRHLRE